MFRTLCLVLILPCLALAKPKAPTPESVLVIYNSSVPQSKELAIFYAAERKIPRAQLIGLPLPDKEEISRDEYNNLIRKPLIAEFDRRKWWDRIKDRDGNLQIASSKIDILCCVRGVPSRIKHPRPAPPEGEAPKPATQQEMMATRSAAVDSELTMLGIEGQSLIGALRNPYFQKDIPFADAKLPILLVGRIDAHSYTVCKRLIIDAIAAERDGLWGFGVVDIANKIPQGDLWLKNVAKDLSDAGIPTLVDRSNDTLPINYPLRDTAVYYGWYDWNVSGPFLNPKFRFKKGAIAVHLHSFSAAQLRNPTKHWCAPLLSKGAAATLGNTYEPFLHLTHHFDIFQKRLLAGYSLVEAAYMAYPSVSWQGVVLGDPLYRPYLRLDGSGKKLEGDKAFRALRIAHLRWSKNPLERENQLRSAATRMKDGTFLEAVGLDLMARNNTSQAAKTFEEAKGLYTESTDKLRMDLQVALIDREAKRTEAAIRTLRDAQLRYSMLEESKAAAAWLNILDPPPPPPAQPKQK